MSATATPLGAPAGRPRRRWPAVGWVLATAGVLAVLLAVVFVVPRLLYPPLPASRFADVDPDKRIELETNRLKLQNDARATLLQALAGGVLLLGAYFTYRQLRVTREGQITDRYTKAMDQLGSEHLDVCLGGIYALERIARDSPPDRATIEEVLTAYVRGHASWPPPRPTPTQPTGTQQPTATATPQPLATASPTAGRGTDGQPDEKAAGPQGPPADVQAAVTVLGRRQLPPDGLRRLDLTRVDLRRARLNGANLQAARLAGANLQGAELFSANLQHAELAGANLQDAWLRGANLQGAELFSANVQGAWLAGANLQGAGLAGANLRDAVLGDASLEGARADETTRWPAGWDRAEAEARGVRYAD